MDSGGFAALGVSFGLFLIFRLARSGVFVYRDGLRVLNPISSRSIPWGGVRTFRLDAWGLFPRMGFVELTDGSAYHLWGIQAPNPAFRPRNRSADRLITELNQLLQDHSEIDVPESVLPRQIRAH